MPAGWSLPREARVTIGNRGPVRSPFRVLARPSGGELRTRRMPAPAPSVGGDLSAAGRASLPDKGHGVHGGSGHRFSVRQRDAERSSPWPLPVEAAIAGPRPWGDVPQGSDSVADLAVANGPMELAAPSCCRLRSLAGAHLVLLAGALDLPRSQCWSIHSSHLTRVATSSFASDSRACAFGSSDVSNAASCRRRRRPCSESAPSNRPTASSCGEIGDPSGMGSDW
jgi:hypothetical protein